MTITVALNDQRPSKLRQLHINGCQGRVVVDIEGVYSGNVDAGKSGKLGIGDEDAVRFLDCCRERHRLQLWKSGEIDDIGLTQDGHVE